MVNSAFSWVHIVRGRPQHPALQGCVERSHSPYKKAILAKLKEHNTEDWVHWMNVVQCEVNNRQNRSRDDLSPYSLYFNQTNKLLYADLLGPVHREAKTEYGLHLARMVLDKVKELDPVKVMTTDEVRFLIRCGDSFFNEVSRSSKEENVSPSNIAKAAKCIQHFHYEIEEGKLVETDGDEVEEEPITEEEPQPMEATNDTARDRDGHHEATHEEHERINGDEVEEEPIAEEEPQPMEATNDTARDGDGHHEAMHDEEEHERIRNRDGNPDPMNDEEEHEQINVDGNPDPMNDKEEHERVNGDENPDPLNDKEEHERVNGDGNPDPMNDKEEHESLNAEEEQGSPEKDNAQEQEEVEESTAQEKSKEQEEDAESPAQGNSQDEEDAQHKNDAHKNDAEKRKKSATKAP
jgi:hypothetical protein